MGRRAGGSPDLNSSFWEDSLRKTTGSFHDFMEVFQWMDIFWVGVGWEVAFLNLQTNVFLHTW